MKRNIIATYIGTDKTDGFIPDRDYKGTIDSHDGVFAFETSDSHSFVRMEYPRYADFMRIWRVEEILA